jgi:CrcB protein
VADMWMILIVGMGGFFGAISRFVIASFVQTHSNTLFPVGTLSVNVLGSFIIGFLAMYFSQVVQPEYKAFLMTGFLGALTTFSTFSLENINMIQDGNYTSAILNITLNIVLTLSATLLAMMLFKKMYM